MDDDDDVALGYTSSLEVRYPVEDEDGRITMITVSEFDRKAVRENPFAAELLKLYRQSPEHKDGMEELHDACTSPSIFESIGDSKESERRDLRNHSPLFAERATEMFRSPIEALRIAQLWELAGNTRRSTFSREFRLKFYEILIALVPKQIADAWSNRRLVTRLRAVEAFLETLFDLLNTWKYADMNIEVWHHFYLPSWHRLQVAQSAVRREYSVKLIDDAGIVSTLPWEKEDRSSQTATASENDQYQRTLMGSVVLADQNSIYEASRTVAFLIFRQVILREIKLSFCDWCKGVFEAGKKTKFCCDYCARARSSSNKKHRTVAEDNRKRIEKAIEILQEWLSRPHIHRRDKWRPYLESELRSHFVFTEDSCRALQSVGSWIKAAHRPIESEERLDIMELCLDDQSSTSDELAIEGSVNKLMALIVEAEMSRSKPQSQQISVASSKRTSRFRTRERSL